MKKSIIYIIIFTFFSMKSIAQVEFVPLTNPIYDYILGVETKGILPHYTLSDLPLQRYEIINILKLIDANKERLSALQVRTLEKYLQEFEVKSRIDAVIIKSSSSDDFLLSSKLFSNDEKLIYHFRDSTHSITIEPLGSIKSMYSISQLSDNRHYNIVQFGGRIYGSLGKVLGYSLQATNGTMLSGDRSLALEDKKFGQNIKFAVLESDIDFTNSHVIYQKKWFFASIEREDRVLGAGLIQHPFLERTAPPMDAINLGVKFKNIRYKYTHGGLLGNIDSSNKWETGFQSKLIPKYLVMHRLAFTPSWGEIALWESSIYSNRQIDIAYLNPLSFLKSVEHSLHDRDNSLMGFDFTIRPIKNLQVKSSFLLDDIIFSKIGTGYWSNKTAFNIALLTSFSFGLDCGLEYARVEPYTYTHFNNHNSYTTDSLLLGSVLLPNSDKTSLLLNWWYGSRYPLKFMISYNRHGDNIIDSQTGKVLRNVGGNPNYGYVYGDSEEVVFLDGVRNDFVSIELSTNYEIFRGFNIGFMYQYLNGSKFDEQRFKININLNDF